MDTKQQYSLLAHFCAAVNSVKRAAYSPQAISESTYLGGDLGIDSIEMLEVWFNLEKLLSIRIADDDKRDIYTVGETLAVVSRYLADSAA